MTPLDDNDGSAEAELDLAALEARFALLGADPDADRGPSGGESPGRDERLAAFERDLLLHECRSLAAQGAAQHPVLGVALGWEERLRRAGHAEDAAAVDGLLAEILLERLRLREREALDALCEEPTETLRDQVFDALISVEELRQSAEDRAGASKQPNAPGVGAVSIEAGRVLVQLRAALLRTLGGCPPGGATRRNWAGRLIDFADEAILGAGERSAQLCTRRLGEAGQALQWHLDHVETGKGEDRKRLLRRSRRVEAERVEQELQARLETAFGPRLVELWERGVLVAILAFVGLMILDLTRGHAHWRVAVDTGLCAFLLCDFFVKAAYVGFRWSWIRRHILTDFIPALPFAWMATLESLEGAATGTGQLTRMLRLIRIARVARYLRLALPLIRMFRALTFMVRGLDRLVRRNARLFEGELVLFPTPEERRRSRAEVTTPEGRMWRLRSALDSAFEQRFEAAGKDGRQRLAAARLRALTDAAAAQVAPRATGRARSARREALPLADDWLRRLGRVGSEEVEARLGVDGVRRVAGGARLVARSPLRFAPLLGNWAPADAADLPDRRVASRVTRALARSARRLHGGILWWADLRGTLTPGEVVGRVGATLVARTSRPAVRLLLFGVLYLFLRLLLSLLGVEVGASSGAASGSDAVSDAMSDGGGFGDMVLEIVGTLQKVVFGAFAVLGSICLALLAIGVWLQRLARDATTFHEQVARAQFLHLTDSIKARERHADAALIGKRVFRLEHRLFEPAGAAEAVAQDERRFVNDLEGFLARGVSPPSVGAGYDPVARSVMLYRDLLDGALLGHTDTRATSQLLGNLAIQRMAQESGRVGRDVHKALRAIDLERRRSFIRGPYLWFHSISRALSSRAARLIVEYNGQAVPLLECDRMGSSEREHFDLWVVGTAPVEGELRAPGSAAQLTTAFTVLHFLDDSPARDEEIGRRFGAAVLERMRRDRRALVRTVFGTYPLHRLPLEARVLNLRSTYADWVEGGRILLFPVRFLWLMLVLGGRGLRTLGRAISAIRKPEIALADLRDAEADFAAAARKIGRMRAPGALAALHLRAILDPEVHGLKLPFQPAAAAGSPDEGVSDRATVDQATVDQATADQATADQATADEARADRSAAERDAMFLGAEPAFLDTLAALEVRASRNLERLERAAADGLLQRIGSRLGQPIEDDAETLRALVVVVHADEAGLRAELFGGEIMVETTIDALEFGLPNVSGFPPVKLRLRFEHWWRRMGGRELVMQGVALSGVVATDTEATLGDVSDAHRRAHDRALERRIRRATWRVLRADVDGVRACLAKIVEAEGLSVAERSAAVEQRLADALRHPTRVTEQLATLRTVQTLGLVDVRNYRRQVWSLGQYAEDGDLGGVLLDLPRA